MHRFLFVLLCLCLAACGAYPRDAHQSSERARDAMRVGVSHDPPYIVVSDGVPHGSEIDVITAFAKARGLQVEWVVDGHDALMEALLDHRLHMVAGGHVGQSPWVESSWSRKFLVTDARGHPAARRIALPPGENAWQLSVDRFLITRDARR